MTLSKRIQNILKLKQNSKYLRKDPQTQAKDKAQKRSFLSFTILLVIISSCKTCLSGEYYFTPDTICYSCHFSCSQCEAETGYCVIPHWGRYIISNSQPCGDCYSGCRNCTGPGESECTACSDEYLLIVNQCKACHYTCATCSGLGYNVPYIDEQGNPQSYINTECLSCNGSRGLINGQYCVDPCYDKYWRVGNICESCHGSCRTCNGLANTNCLTCEAGLYMNLGGAPNSCVSSCSFPSTSNDVNFRCFICHPTCLVCKGEANNDCIQCYGQNFLYQGTCISQCPSGVFQHPTLNECIQTCPTRYYGNTLNQKCEICDSTCYKCTGPNST